MRAEREAEEAADDAEEMAAARPGHEDDVSGMTAAAGTLAVGVVTAGAMAGLGGLRAGGAGWPGVVSRPALAWDGRRPRATGTAPVLDRQGQRPLLLLPLPLFPLSLQ